MIRRQLWTWEIVINVRRVRTSDCCDECVVEEYRYVQHDRFRYPLHGGSPGPVLVVEGSYERGLDADEHGPL